MVSNTSRQFNSFASSGESPTCGCMPTGVAFTMASKNSRRTRARAIASPPTARASAFALLRPPRTDANRSARLRQRERHRASRATRSDDQHAAAAQRHAPLESAQHADVIRVVPVEFPAAAHDDRVHGADSRRQRIATVEMPQDAFLVRQRHAETSDAERLDRTRENPSDRAPETADRRRSSAAPRIPRSASPAKANGRWDFRSRRTRASARRTRPRDRRASFLRARFGPAPWRSRPARRRTRASPRSARNRAGKRHVAHRHGDDVPLLLREIAAASDYRPANRTARRS